LETISSVPISAARAVPNNAKTARATAANFGR